MITAKLLPRNQARSCLTSSTRALTLAILLRSRCALSAILMALLRMELSLMPLLALGSARDSDLPRDMDL